MLSYNPDVRRRNYLTGRGIGPTAISGTLSFRRRSRLHIVGGTVHCAANALVKPPVRSLLAFAAATVLAMPCVHAAEERVGRDAERGDPARWFEPDDTPQKKHRTAMKEAAAARAEALKACSAEPQRKACEEEARRQYENEVQRARAHLVRPSQG